jgi:hypothetical protein
MSILFYCFAGLRLRVTGSVNNGETYSPVLDNLAEVLVISPVRFGRKSVAEEVAGGQKAA